MIDLEVLHNPTDGLQQGLSAFDAQCAIKDLNWKKRVYGCTDKDQDGRFNSYKKTTQQIKIGTTILCVGIRFLPYAKAKGRWYVRKV